MYAHYFGLTEKPFAIAPNPRFLYMSEQHREALAHLLYGINSDGCIILLTGDVGTGKTTLCRLLMEQLPDTTDVAIVLNPKLSITDLLKTLCTELKIHIDHPSPTVKTYVDRLDDFLLKTHARGRNTALIIDEAQNLESEVLEQLRLLTNLETNTKKLLQIVLVGQSELRDVLNDSGLAQINQRVTTRYHLRPLVANDVSSYIHHRLSVAGGVGRETLFTGQAIRYIAKFSKGIPRLINLLCDHALLGAYADNKDHVDIAIVKKAAGEIKAIDSGKSSSIGKIIILTVVLALIVVLPAAVYYILNNDDGIFIKNFGWKFGSVSEAPKEVVEPLPIIIEE